MLFTQLYNFVWVKQHVTIKQLLKMYLHMYLHIYHTTYMYLQLIKSYIEFVVIKILAKTGYNKTDNEKESFGVIFLVQCLLREWGEFK